MPGMNATKEQDQQDYLNRSMSQDKVDRPERASGQQANEGDPYAEDGDKSVSPLVSNTLIISALLEVFIAKGIVTEQELIDAITSSAVSPEQKMGKEVPTSGAGGADVSGQNGEGPNGSAGNGTTAPGGVGQ